jgi:hypothetical protein
MRAASLGFCLHRLGKTGLYVLGRLVGECYHVGTARVLPAGNYLAMVTFIGDRGRGSFGGACLSFAFPSLNASGKPHRASQVCRVKLLRHKHCGSCRQDESIPPPIFSLAILLSLLLSANSIGADCGNHQSRVRFANGTATNVSERKYDWKPDEMEWPNPR